MKKLFSLILVCSFILCPVSCGISSPNEAPALPTDTPSADSSAEPSVDETAEPASTDVLPDVYEGFKTHDVEALRSFLDNRGDDGKSNGEKLFEQYDCASLDTWYYFDNEKEREDDHKRYIAEWDDEGNLAKLELPFPDVELTGMLDLSGCERLERVSLNTNGLDALNVSGCPLSLGLIIGDPALKELLPEALELSGLCIGKTALTHINWHAVPAPEINPSGLGGDREFKLELDAVGPGSVGVSSAIGEHSVELVIYAYPQEGKQFIGWFDADGKLASKNRFWELPVIEAASDTDSEYYYAARFE